MTPDKHQDPRYWGWAPWLATRWPMHAALPLPCADALAPDLAGKPLLSMGMHQSSDAPKSLISQDVALQALG